MRRYPPLWAILLFGWLAVPFVVLFVLLYVLTESVFVLLVAGQWLGRRLFRRRLTRHGRSVAW